MHYCEYVTWGLSKSSGHLFIGILWIITMEGRGSLLGSHHMDWGLYWGPLILGNYQVEV